MLQFGPTQDIGDAKNRRPRTVGTIRISMRLGRFVATAEFIVCEKLAVPLILGAYYCDRFVEAIYPRKKTVEKIGRRYRLSDGSRRKKGRIISSQGRKRMMERGSKFPPW